MWSQCRTPMGTLPEVCAWGGGGWFPRALTPPDVRVLFGEPPAGVSTHTNACGHCHVHEHLQAFLHVEPPAGVYARRKPAGRFHVHERLPAFRRTNAWGVFVRTDTLDPPERPGHYAGVFMLWNLEELCAAGVWANTCGLCFVFCASTCTLTPADISPPCMHMPAGPLLVAAQENTCRS